MIIIFNDEVHRVNKLVVQEEKDHPVTAVLMGEIEWTELSTVYPIQHQAELTDGTP